MTVARSPWSARLLAVALGSSVGVGGAALVLSSVGWAGLPWVQRAAQERRAAADEAQRELEARQRLAELRARVQPRTPVRAFDIDALRAQPSVTAEAELQALLQDLRRAREHRIRGAYWSTTQDMESAAQRMALFRWRFGTSPESVSGWLAIESEAKELLSDVEIAAAVEEPARFRLDEEDSYDSLFHALLLELAGRVQQADEWLAKTAVHSMCGNCADGRESVVWQRRSEATGRRGDWKSAIDVAVGTRGGPSLSCYGEELVASEAHEDAWLGVLFLASPRVDDGVLLLQQVVDLFPGTPGAEVARAALIQIGALVEPSAQRLRDAYIDALRPGADGTEPSGSWQRRIALAAYGGHRYDRAFEQLQSWWADGQDGALQGLVALGDERARPFFERELVTGELYESEVPLGALAALSGGLRPSVGALLARMSHATVGVSWGSLVPTDELLRASFGGGPTFEVPFEGGYAAFARAWQDWIAAQAAPR